MQWHARGFCARPLLRLSRFLGEAFLFPISPVERLIQRRGRGGTQSKSFLRALAVLCVVCVASCSADRKLELDESALTPIVDDFGDTIVIDRRPERIVSLTPATTEILFALGAGDRLVGRGEYDKWPDAALAVPNLGPGLRPNIVAEVTARPELLLLEQSQDNSPGAHRLRTAGI